MTPPRAGTIIANMENLLERRRTKQIGRKGFLIAWGKLRIAMRLTDDYKKLVDKCRNRAGGMCEFCSATPGIHMHHIKPAAFYPRLILIEQNVAWSCAKCHPLEDKKSRRAALDARTLQIRHAERTQIRSIPAPPFAAPKARSG